LYYNPSVTTSRRNLLAAAALPLLARAAPQALKIVVAGGHPGDPECGCAGTIARYTELGHQVVLLYLNRGEGYCGAATLDRCAAIRTAEAQKACQILKARAAFAGQYDGRAIVDASHYEAFARLLAAENPDVVFTHWPIDRHRDHRAIRRGHHDVLAHRVCRYLHGGIPPPQRLLRARLTAARQVVSQTGRDHEIPRHRGRFPAS